VAVVNLIYERIIELGLGEETLDMFPFFINP